MTIIRNQEQTGTARNSAQQMQLDVVALACNPSTQEASLVYGQTGPHSEAVSIRRKAKKEEQRPSETRKQILTQFKCVCLHVCVCEGVHVHLCARL